MAGIRELSCPSCSAPVTVQAGMARATCDYCQASLSVEFNHGEAVLHSAAHISGTIRAESERTLSTLERMQLEQQRGQLQQQWATYRVHMDNLDSELRALRRVKKSRVVRGQMRDLETRQRHLAHQLASLDYQIATINDRLNPQPPGAPAYTAPATYTRRQTPTNWMPFLWIMGILFLPYVALPLGVWKLTPLEKRIPLARGFGLGVLAFLLWGFINLGLQAFVAAVQGVPQSSMGLDGLALALYQLTLLGWFTAGFWYGWNPARGNRILGQIWRTLRPAKTVTVASAATSDEKSNSLLNI